MVEIPRATFSMGAGDFYPEEGPVRQVNVDGFRMDAQPVTVEEVRRFVAETDYVTVAERELDPALYPDADPALLVPGSLVFRRSSGPVDLGDFRHWWSYVPGACWRRPEGPGSGLAGRRRHPVTQIACEDAEAYAAWAGKALPTEAEWELAARGGLDGARFAWGDEETPDGKVLANYWQGEFPWQNLRLDGYELTSPVGSFPPNGYGLHDMTGNVWEWTSDLFEARGAAARPCCAPSHAGERIPRRVIRGGSHLCAANYCLRYRPAARQGEAVDTSTSHIGFRCGLRGRGGAARAGLSVIPPAGEVRSPGRRAESRHVGQANRGGNAARRRNAALDRGDLRRLGAASGAQHGQLGRDELAPARERPDPHRARGDARRPLVRHRRRHAAPARHAAAAAPAA